MGWLKFISDLVASLAWPMTALAIVIVLRAPLGGLIGGVRKLSYRALQVDFSAEVQRVEVLAARAEIPASEDLSGDGDVTSLFRVAPRAAVIESWLAIEHELGVLSQQRNLTGSLTLLERNGVVTHDLAMLIRSLRDLRNTAARSEEFSLTPDEAERYADVTQRVTEALRLLADEQSWESPPY